jgi:competence ComEA-like helix-hairpin-helix protein
MNKLKKLLVSAVFLGMAAVNGWAAAPSTAPPPPPAPMPARPAPNAAPASTDAAPSQLLDINSATAEQLDQGMAKIGKVKAAAIVADREKNGKFKSIDDLSRVKGISAKIIEANKDKIIAK